MQAVHPQCPHCNIRLDVPRSIRVIAKAIATYNLNVETGRLEGEEAFITKRGSFRCTQCGCRLNKFIKEVQVGIIGGEKDATANTPTDVRVKGG